MINNNLFTWRIVLRLSATFVLALFILASCKKKNTSLGVNSIDQNELLNSGQIDTFSIFSYTESEDSVVTSNPAYALLGSYNDPKFGPCDASFYTQIRLPAPNPAFGDLSTIVIDSFVLGLQYQGFYGDLSAQTLEVYEMTESINIDSTYYAFTNKGFGTTNLVDPNRNVLTPDPYTKNVIDTTHVPAQMRVYLDTNLAKTFMNEAATNSTTFASNDNFLNYFKGLHVKVNNGNQLSGKGGILYFDLRTALSKLTIYYHQAGTKKTYDFVINSNSAMYNKVAIDNSGMPVEDVITTNSLGQTQFYCQALKSRAVIGLPGLKSLPKTAIIHEAKLYLPIEYQTGYKYTPGSRLDVSTHMEDGTEALFSLHDLGVVGVYDEFNKQFIINIRPYAQAIVSGQRFSVLISGTYVNLLVKGTEIHVNPTVFNNSYTFNNSSSSRIVFNGSNSSNKNKPKLILKYTEF